MSGPVNVADEAGIGRPVRRKEDLRLLTGRGSFSDDLTLPGQVYAVMVRSPHAHARIKSIDITAARAMPGVLDVLTGKDVEAAGLAPIVHPHSPPHPPDVRLDNRDGSKRFSSPHRLLPTDKVRYVGEGVAIVIADSLNAAKDAAERVVVEYEPLPAVAATAAAAERNAPRIWGDLATNVVVDADVGDKAGTDAAFAKAAHVVRLESWIGRIAPVTMEPRAAVADYDVTTDRSTLYAGSGGVVRQKHEIAGALKLDPAKIRVVSRDVGGNFGTRNSIYVEFILIVWAARRLKRPVKWICERRDAFLSDYQGRDLVVDAELALDKDGNFLAVRGAMLSNLGGHTVSFVAIVKGPGLITGVYHVPVAYVHARAVLSSTAPTHPYRSTGRPEAMFVIERLIELAVREHGFDPIKLRRRNLIPPRAQPYANPVGLTYDSGDYPLAMERALALGDWKGFPARRREARKRGKLRGIGIANYIEITSGAPRERAEITVLPEGRIDVVIGTLASGQGHETSFAQLLVDWLSVPIGCIRLITGDTDIISVGGGSHSARSMRLAGIVIGKARDVLIEKGRRIAAHALEVAEADVEFDTNSGLGRFVVRGTDRALGLFEVARAAAELKGLPPELSGRFGAEGDEVVTTPGYPYGCHVCEVEIDPDTGKVDLVRHAAVDDVGRAINPLILHGQAHGASTQGIGQALMEHAVYDVDGQLLSGSFMDYAMPRAADLPSFLTEISEVPSPTNPLGVRGGGEGGTTPALAVVVNAVVDALSEFGVRHIEMPVTSERVWRAINEARSKRA